MAKCIISGLLCLLLQSVCASLYTAAVVEYHYQYNQNLTAEDNLLRNTEVYTNIISTLNVEIQIVVFPENGLTGGVMEEGNTVEVPDPVAQPQKFHNNKVLTLLSTAAAKKKVYLVVNLFEKAKDKKYNTNVVFSNKGDIIAKYRKYHLYNETVDHPSQPDLVQFTTDFNVTFGTFTCFDILFESPALDLVKKGVRNFVFTTHWFSELPYLTAIQYQKGWAYANNANLLAAGFNDPKKGSTGSGIYNGRGKDLPGHYIQSNVDRTYVIVRTLDSDTSRIIDTDVKELNNHEFVFHNSVESNSAERYNGEVTLSIIKENMKDYTTKKIEPTKACKETKRIDKDVVIKIYECQIGDHICNNGVCCQFDVNVTFMGILNSTYIPKPDAIRRVVDGFMLSKHRLAVYNGPLNTGMTEVWVQACSVVSCTGEDQDSCGGGPDPAKFKPLPYNDTDGLFQIVATLFSRVRVEGNLASSGSFASPSSLLGHMEPSEEFGLLPLQVRFDKSESGNATYELVGHQSPVGTAGFLSRVFSKDGQSNSSSQLSPILWLAFVFVAFLHLFSVHFYF